MSGEYSIEFVPGGTVDIGGPTGIYAIPGASNVEAARNAVAGPATAQQPASPAIRQLRTVARSAATPTSQDPATCIADRISALQLEMSQIQIEIARMTGIKAELRQLKKAMVAFKGSK